MSNREQLVAALRMAKNDGNERAAMAIARRIASMSKETKPAQKEPTEAIKESRDNQTYQPISEPEPGDTGNIASPIAQGATFGFADELMGAGAEVGSLVRNLWGTLQGKAPVIGREGRAYTSARDTERQRVKDFAGRNPKTALGAEIVGGLATGGLGAVKAVPTITKQAGKVLGSRVAPTAATALVGAGEGAVGGAGYSEGEDLQSVAKDAGAGAGLGLFLGGIGGEILGGLARRRERLDDVSRLIEAQPGSIDTAGFRTVPEQQSIGRDFVRRLGSGAGPSSAGTAAKDALARKAMDQGFDAGIVAPLQRASKQDANKMIKMTNIMERGLKDRAYQLRNRPADIAGNSLNNRISSVLKFNRQAANKLEETANSLKGKTVDIVEPLRSFEKNLNKSGIRLTRDGDKVQVDFSGSDIEGLTKAEKVIKRMVKRTNQIKRNPDAYEAHRLKKYIDENVSFGKRTEGLSGRMENILKNLRRDLDRNLDSSFPKYDKINTKFSDTKNALDQIQLAVGKNLDLSSPSAEKALGQELRKLMSNYRSRTNLLDAIPALEETAKKYGKKFKDDLELQTRFVDELHRKFGTPASTSLAGETEKAVTKGIETATGGKLNAATEIAQAAIRKAKGVSDQNAFRSMKELLRRQAQ